MHKASTDGEKSVKKNKCKVQRSAKVLLTE